MRWLPVLAFASAVWAGSPYPLVEDPSPGVVKTAVEALTEAFKGKDTAAQIAVIRSQGGINSPDVVHALAKGLRSRDEGVKIETIAALGWNQSPEALKQLHRLYRREGKLLAEREDPYAALFKAIGRHGDKSSLTVLADSPFKGLTPKVAEARIFGIANIREKKSIEALMKGMRLTTEESGGRRSRSVDTRSRGMRFFRPALCVLTGLDMGESDDEWQSWWRDVKNKFRISEKRPASAPADVKKYWEGYWDVSY
ncbi:MAG TPA: HEAT repeat domain-containing protein [Planctomycetota bacterium]|nr:HEAT repeat domain-containing protein [Planctomycetota bacterium]